MSSARRPSALASVPPVAGTSSSEGLPCVAPTGVIAISGGVGGVGGNFVAPPPHPRARTQTSEPTARNLIMRRTIPRLARRWLVSPCRLTISTAGDEHESCRQDGNGVVADHGRAGGGRATDCQCLRRFFLQSRR